MSQNNKYLALARREFWEHRGLWLVPLVGAGLLLCSALFGGGTGFRNGMQAPVNSDLPAGAGEAFGSVSSLMILAVIGLFACIVTFIYLLDCLFAERKDRSILFWKSLPVSDAETVLSKLAVAVVLMPLFVLVLAVLLQPLLAGVVALRVPELRPYVFELLGGSLGALPKVIGIGIFGLLWYAPLATYLMLASVLARRAPIVYAIVPPVALVVAEWLVFSTKHVARLIGERVMPWPGMGDSLFTINADRTATVNPQWSVLFGDPGLWLGLLAAAAMAYGVIRLRRYRDDT